MTDGVCAQREEVAEGFGWTEEGGGGRRWEVVHPCPRKPPH